MKKAEGMKWVSRAKHKKNAGKGKNFINKQIRNNIKRALNKI